MAENKDKKKNKNNKVEKKKEYRGPQDRLWGKIIIGILAVAMCCGGLITVIYLIVNSIIH